MGDEGPEDILLGGEARVLQLDHAPGVHISAEAFQDPDHGEVMAAAHVHADVKFPEDFRQRDFPQFMGAVFGGGDHVPFQEGGAVIGRDAAEFLEEGFLIGTLAADHVEVIRLIHEDAFVRGIGFP